MAHACDNERLRIQHAFWLSIIGLTLAAALAVLLVRRQEMKVSTSAEVAAIVGLFTSVTGTLVGAFFGLQIGAAGAEHERRSRQRAEESRQRAEQLTRRALAHLHPDVAKGIVDAAEAEGNR
jgi:vacuolar-type H+-ATPase subunit I/STV1